MDYILVFFQMSRMFGLVVFFVLLNTLPIHNVIVLPQRMLYNLDINLVFVEDNT